MEEEGELPPPAYYEQPEIWAEAAFFWKAFSDLSPDRSSGMGLGPIPFRSMVTYAGLYGLSDVDEFERFRQIVSDADGEYLRLNAPKSEQDSKMRSLVYVDDTDGVSSLLSRLGKTEP